MSIIQTEFPLQFANYEDDLTQEDLNGVYGEKGMTYPKLGQAKAALMAMGFVPKSATSGVWEKEGNIAYVTRLRDLQVNGLDPTDKNSRDYIEKGALITFAGNEFCWRT